jgi:GNAT superfamily N-acetyltransferase/nitroimidazol reductase NimA-like FMN-containing flavoprotein (pyridoxamine 5'-phosphate oxidase superfamily)
MRRKQRQTSLEQVGALLERTRVYQLATVTPGGKPVLRTLNGVWVEGWVLFHGAVGGEKSSCLGGSAVVSAYEEIAFLPSYFFDHARATPATTFYESAEIQGTLCDVADPDLKVKMLSALMRKYQPEGGYQELSSTSELYKKDLRSVRVFGVRAEALCGKANLGQDKPLEVVKAIVEGLWKRGEPGDCSAIERILAHNEEARPLSLRATMHDHAIRLVVSASPLLVNMHAELLCEQYWRKGVTLREIETSIWGSSAWVGAIDSGGRLLGAARASSDSAWSAQIMDVVVSEEARSQGIGTRLMEVLLDHPAVRGCRFQRLGTQDAMNFYRKWGFALAEDISLGFPSYTMLRRLE